MTTDSSVEPDPSLVQRSVDLALENVDAGGKPFACLVVRDGETLLEATNQVAQTGDVTAHAEIEALRRAAERGLTDLSDCDIYITAHPCPMCLGALYYAQPRSVIYAATREQENEHYEDGNRYMTLATFYDEFPLEPEDRQLPMLQGRSEDPAAPFRSWTEQNG
ncbi:nucleoside deaminase [Arthrobacter echini]|uniref:Nucleoside deaminase n=1 Tax=Arthrobacter echini TaxID=1529066 RepID=A0A5D0XU73_9MICC|nr:nucleoside deaminase [Arthrobacter echini]TYD00415.1 nucleoside deaminase [Arthrobacter echini]